MPETAEQIYDRCHDRLVLPDVAEWETFPFAGVLDVRPLAAPLEAEPPRRGAGGVDCRGCGRPDSDYLWTDAEWRVASTKAPTGMPVVLFVEPREHFAEPGDLPDDLAASMGRMLGRVERAVRGIGEIGRVHVCRWGDGSEHLHWWVIARPARLPQVVGSLCELWDEVLPPTPEEIWRDNLDRVVAALRAG
jgi:diadenosine tetraphosphate (Ap4A) HIT family hydrolase